ncbi:GNAT family N-acetyltransferase [Bacteroidota bacterium]
MNTNIKFRKATSSDASAISELCKELGYLSSETKVNVRLGNILSLKDNEVFVAETTGYVVVGWVHIFATHRIESNSFAELGGLVVNSLYRGKGIGKNLIKVAEEWALMNGYNIVRIRSKIIRERAHKLFEQIGYGKNKTQHVFSKKLISH